MRKFFAGFTFLLLFIGTPSCYTQNKSPISVTEVKILKIPLCIELEALGTTLANESVLITANATEKVKKVLFEDGQKVEAGEILVELDKAEEESELKALEALLIEKKPSFERAKVLVNKKVTTKAALETREASLRQVEADMEVIKAKINDRIIRAPFSGILDFRDVSVGTLVKPGDIITKLYDISTIKVNFEVPSLFLSRLNIGQEVQGKIEAYPNKVFKGKIIAISPQVNPSTRTIPVRSIIPNKDLLLKPGLLIRLSIKTNKRDALVVPEGAIKQKGHEHFIYILRRNGNKGDFAELKKVGIGIRKTGLVEIIDGLKEGDSIVERGVLPFQDKQPVTVVKSNIYSSTDLSKFQCDGDP